MTALERHRLRLFLRIVVVSTLTAIAVSVLQISALLGRRGRKEPIRASGVTLRS